MKFCEICGQEFIPSRRHPQQKYCSKKCREEAHLLKCGVKLICQYCRNPFLVPPSKADQRKFCSSKCANNIYQPIQKICAFCKKSFIVSPARKETAKWCSIECYNLHRQQNRHLQPAWSGGPNVRSICEICGTEIWDYKPRQFCSHACTGISYQKREIVICHNCGQDFESPLSANRKYCSIECFHAALPQKHSAWGDDLLKKILKILNYPPYQLEKTFSWLKSPRNWPLWLDLYIPSQRLAIEFDGEQHFKYSPLFHKSYDEFEYQKLLDMIKEILCNEYGIRLVRFTYNENLSPESIRSKLLV